jgi:hypothetical protein
MSADMPHAALPGVARRGAVQPSGKRRGAAHEGVCARVRARALRSATRTRTHARRHRGNRGIRSIAPIPSLVERGLREPKMSSFLRLCAAVGRSPFEMLAATLARLPAAPGGIPAGGTSSEPPPRPSGHAVAQPPSPAAGTSSERVADTRTVPRREALPLLCTVPCGQERPLLGRLERTPVAAVTPRPPPAARPSIEMPGVAPVGKRTRDAS